MKLYFIFYFFYLTHTTITADISENVEFQKAVKALSSTNTTFNGPIPFRVPYHVSIQAKDGASNKYVHLCSGSIIHEQIILTAAHCFYEVSKPSLISVVAGDNLLSVAPRPRHNVSAIVLHEYYYPLQGRDIALVKLARPLKLDGVILEKIGYKISESMENTKPAYLIGYGREVKTLEAIDFTTLDMATCRNSGYVYVTSTDLCARSLYGRGAGDGDSGGALVDPSLSVQYALLSYGRGICVPKSIYVFTSTYRLADWITSNIVRLVK